MIKVLLKGPMLSRSGYGLQSLTLLRALRKFPERFDVYVINTAWGATSWTWEDTEERRWIDQSLQKTLLYQQKGGKFDISIQVTIPPEWQKLAPINIGYTAGIESTKISPQWMMACTNVNKILVISEHARYAFDNTLYPATDNNTGRQFMAKVETPIVVTPYPVREIEPKPIDIDFKHDFNFLTVAQWCPRKNLENTIKWFVEEFKDKNVGLVLKINLIKNCLMDREAAEHRVKSILAPLGERKCTVHLLHGDLTDEEMTFLYRHPKIKAMLSLANAEGWGLPLFEAVYNGLPVVAPNWGGQCDFINMPVKDKKTGKVKNTCMITEVSYDMKHVQPEAVWDTMIIKESQWCFPIENSAREKMREVYKNYGACLSKAKKLKEYVLKRFNEKDILTHFADQIFEDNNVLDVMDFLKEEKEVNPLLKEIVAYD